jgi:hypothetical protein
MVFSFPSPWFHLELGLIFFYYRTPMTGLRMNQPLGSYLLT